MECSKVKNLLQFTRPAAKVASIVAQVQENTRHQKWKLSENGVVMKMMAEKAGIGINDYVSVTDPLINFFPIFFFWIIRF